MAKQGIFSLLHSAVDITSDVMADVVRLYRLHNGILSSELVPSIPSCWGGGGVPSTALAEEERKREQCT